MLQTSFAHKLGNTRAGNGTRLWLEGKRLLDHGFTHRATCERIWSENKLVIRIVPQDTLLPRANKTTIAGAIDRPIIDITGAQIARTFPSGQVIVTWSLNSITVQGI